MSELLLRPDDVSVLCVVGFQNAGKSALVESLVRTLRVSGLRVAFIKHDGHADLAHGVDRSMWEKWNADTVRAAKAGAPLGR